MDLFPDWGEIELKVKMCMVAFHVVFIVLTYLLLFKTGPTPSGRGRRIIFIALSGAAGVVLFASMFAFDWASVLP